MSRRRSVAQLVLMASWMALCTCGCRRIVAAEDIIGYWSGDWGDMILERGADDLVYGAYSHDEGALSGTFADEKMVGRWCEVPSREPVDDAGDVEFSFAYNGDTLALDGRWRYGDQGDYREDWDVTRQSGDGPAELQARLDSELRCP